MALSLVFMCGRLGAFVGINIFAAVLYGYCSEMFAVCGAILIISGGFSYIILTNINRVAEIEKTVTTNL